MDWEDVDDNFLESLAKISARYPLVGSISGIVFCSIALYFLWINPNAIDGTGFLWGIILGVLGALTLMMVLVGYGYQWLQNKK